jgi:hypothetical protein
VGERTAGAVLAGRCFLLSDRSLLYLAVAGIRGDGERLEGGAWNRTSRSWTLFDLPTAPIRNCRRRSISPVVELGKARAIQHCWHTVQD